MKLKKIPHAFKEQVIQPALKKLNDASPSKNSINSPAAEKLLLMIAAHESGSFLYMRQIKGPALSPFQMEPNTFEDLLNWLAVERPHYYRVLQDIIPGEEQAEYLLCSPFYAAAVSRLNLLRFPESLPADDDIEGLAKYAKKYWNTNAGKATWQDYYKAYMDLSDG